MAKIYTKDFDINLSRIKKKPKIANNNNLYINSENNINNNNIFILLFIQPYFTI